jgi:manganese transport protein
LSLDEIVNDRGSQAWGWRTGLLLMGPAFVASFAYVDPGNFATNVQAGARYGYLLLWVVLLANVVAMLLQYLSAKLGIATGRSLPELCRDQYPKPVVWGLWAQAEIVAVMTTWPNSWVGRSLCNCSSACRCLRVWW